MVLSFFLRCSPLEAFFTIFRHFNSNFTWRLVIFSSLLPQSGFISCTASIWFHILHCLNLVSYLALPQSGFISCTASIWFHILHCLNLVSYLALPQSGFVSCTASFWFHIFHSPVIFE